MSGDSSHTIVMNIGSTKKLTLRKDLWDPGYTSGYGLFEYNKVKVVKDFSGIEYSNSKKLLELDEEDYSPNLRNRIRSIINSRLKSYGVTVSWKSIYIGAGKNFVVNTNSTTRQLFAIQLKQTKISGGWPPYYTFMVKIIK